MALICSLFYGPDFLTSPLLAHATLDNLTSIKRYRQLLNFMPEGDCLKEAARVALNTCEGHLDYLSPPHITWSLENADFTVEEIQVLVTALLVRVLDLPPNRPAYPGLALPSPGMTGSDPAERALNTLRTTSLDSTMRRTCSTI